MEYTGQTSNGLQLNVQQGMPPVIHAAGELNYQNCDVLHRLIRASFGPTCVVSLDLADLDFVDSSGLRILATAAIEAERTGGSLQISSLTRQLSHALEISRLKGLFDITVPAVDIKMPSDVCRPLDQPRTFELTPALDSCRDARRVVCEFAMSMGFNDEALDDIRLAVGEAVSNAVRHGKCGQDCVNICCREENKRLLVTLRYPSQRFDPDSVPEPDLAASPEGGMGIYFMRLAMDSVDYAFGEGFATVTLEKSLTPIG